LQIITIAPGGVIRDRKKDIAMRRSSISSLILVGSLLIEDVILPAKAAEFAAADEPIAWAIVVHAGSGNAGGPAPGEVLNPRQKSFRSYLAMGRQMLADGANSIDVCEKVVHAFEDDSQFNAGKGAVATADGGHSLDAAIMDGSNLKFGAVAGVRTVKNPIALARLVMDKTKHVMLIRDGAEAFAEQMGLDIVPSTYFINPPAATTPEKTTPEKPKQGGDTVGCACLDRQGNLAAATSTGGIGGVMPGRVGDSPICGAGTYANNKTCAVSCTGTGEQFIRHNAAHTISALMEYKGLTVEQAANELVFNILNKGDGGAIAVSRTGQIAMPFNTAGMARGCADSRGRFEFGSGAETKKELLR
jgi:L-asparaginase / beta-aspartyl-peptidase